MTDLTKLVARLRGTPLYEAWGEASDMPEQAADTIEALAKESAALKARAEAAEDKVARLVEAVKEQREAESAPDELFCCNGQHCGCRGASRRDYAEYLVTKALREIGGQQ